MGVIKSSNPLVRLYAGQIYYGHRTINDVPTHYLTEVQTELANYGEDPYIDDHWHFMTDVQGLVDALASKETPEGAQSKADKALTDAQAHTISKIAEMVNGSPAALDTLFEIAASLNNDPNFATTIVNQLGTKVDKVTGKVLSTNDYTTAEKTKLSGVATNANNYIHPTDHPATMITGLASVATSGSYVDLTNKPTIPALNNTVTSTSTTQSATANAVKTAYDLANASVNRSGDTMTGALVAQNNTSYTTKQVRNMILSPSDAVLSSMQNGDIWIKYK